MQKNVITIKDLTYGFNLNKVIDSASLQINEGEFVCITGANGAGKTTLLNLLIGETCADSGDIFWYGKKISKFNDWKVVGYHPQFRQFNQAFPATVFEIVSLGLYSKQGLFHLNGKSDREKVKQALKLTDMLPFINQQIGCLSGGQQQRVMLSKLLVASPKVFILDEPTVGIDNKTKQDILALLRKLNKESKATIIIVTHDVSGINYNTDKIYQFSGGKTNLLKLAEAE